MVPVDFDVVLPIRFKENNGNFINIREWLLVNNFFGHLIR